MTDGLPKLLTDLLKSRVLDTLPHVSPTAPDTKTKRHRREFVKAIKRQLAFLHNDHLVYQAYENGGKRYVIDPQYATGYIRWWDKKTLELSIRKATSVFMSEPNGGGGFGATYLGCPHKSHEEVAQTLLKLIGYTELGYFDEYLTIWDF